MARGNGWIISLVTLAAVFDSGAMNARTPTRAHAPPNVLRAATPALVINEIQADPTKVSDANGEWFEVYNAGASAVNIQNYHIASSNDAGFTVTTSVSVPAGGYVVLGKVSSTATNGGVTVDYAFGPSLNLSNTADWLAIRDANNVTVDSVAWTSTTPGKSWGLKNPLAAHAAVEGPLWQLATSTYGRGDFGTPRKRNDGFVSPPVSELVVRVLDVGQGDANYISNGTSKIIIDGGPSAPRFGALLDSLGLNNATINVVILTHQHSDHLAGLQELFRSSRHITVNYFFENKDPYTSVGIATLRDSINSRVSRGHLIYRDTDDPCATGKPTCDISLNGGAKMHILRPMPGDANPNNRSVVVKLIGPDSASFSMWFAGDAEQQAIAWYLGAAGYATNPGMHVNVLKADHHGSCNGVTNAYLNALNPDYVTASVGAVNTYGHMHNQARTVFAARGKPWYRTDGNGTIVLRTPGTPGGGYTIAVTKGAKNMSGASDATSTQTECNPIP
jgi:beta-lactamase superfamily II metal-dependent hydrolase